MLKGVSLLVDFNHVEWEKRKENKSVEGNRFGRETKKRKITKKKRKEKWEMRKLR